MSKKTPQAYLNPAALPAAAKCNLENFVAASTPGGIEAQEAREQLKAVASQQLPGEGTSSPGDRARWESLGFVFKEPVDDLLINVQFPQGWTLKATEHSMWSDLLDNKGRRRASMFYKGAFYDRHAHIHLVRRYESSGYHESKDKGMFDVVVKDGDLVLKTFGSVSKYYGTETEQKRTQPMNEAITWLDQTYPQWRDVMAYWD